MNNIGRMEDDIYNLRILAAEQRDLISALQTQQTILESRIAPLDVGAPPIVNYVRNGDLAHSFDTYFRATPIADDARFECWNVYKHSAPVAAQQLLEDSVYSGALVAASTALPDNGRSDTPVVDPDWSRANGYARLGSTNSLDFPFPSNVAFPGRTLYILLAVARRTANVGVPGRLYAGVWDNTAGQRNWLTADPFVLTADIIGSPAATTSRDYLVVLTSDYGKTVKSAVLTVANAPSDASFISGSVYVRLSWPRFAGFIQADIYRKTGGVYVLLSQESTATQYFDQGSSRQVVGNYPDTSDTIQRAITYTREGLLDDAPIDTVDPAWRSLVLAIEIPATYDQGVTTGKQWLRIGLDQACDGTDADRGLLIDLVGAGYTAGSWAHNSDDLLGLQQPASAPAGSSQGGAGTGGTGFEPPDPGTGGARCIAPSSMVALAIGTNAFYTKEANELRKDPAHVLLSMDEDGNLTTGAIDRVSDGSVEHLYTVRTKAGAVLRCSDEQRLITYVGDTIGTPLRRLRRGDPLVCYIWKSKSLQETTITSITKRTQATKRSRVIRIHMAKNSPQTFFAGEGGVGAICCHNLKSETEGGAV